MYGLKPVPFTAAQSEEFGARVEKPTSAAKAVKRSPFYATAEAVPFV